MANKNIKHDSTFCLIVGAGMTGVSLGAHLLKRGVLNHSEFKLIDQQSDYGGVWEQNKYPGAACDIPSHGYVMRFFLKPGRQITIPA
jgi:cation diffusion facilitator CzcD-associated flavoprotein CzcO